MKEVKVFNDYQYKEDNTQFRENEITIRNLHKSFGDNKVLRGINLELKKKENVAVLGKSGIGKSVLLKCIVRLIYPEVGYINVLGKDIHQLEDEEMNEIRKKIGYVFQGGALYDSLSVRENLEFPMRRTQEKTSEELFDTVEEALDSVGLIGAMDKMPSELSGGMKKRIGLARALIMKPKIILYDEPTTGLDPVTSGEISELILKIKDKYDTSSIIVTHDLKCARITAPDNINLLKNGVFYASGTFEEMEKNHDIEVHSYFN